MGTTLSSYPEICWWRLGLYPTIDKIYDPTGLFLLGQISGISDSGRFWQNRACAVDCYTVCCLNELQVQD